MEKIELLLLSINQRLDSLDSENTLRAVYHEERKTISLGDVTNGRVLRIPLESGFYFRFPILLETKIHQLSNLFGEEDQMKIEQAINLRKTLLLS